jgi:alkanesulfonate monooxygenase SsuD/methylene tetrahydromethanopterin reductase-like flavin-dependent oxidoreductase (luciferase family)
MQIGMTLPTMVAGLDRATILEWCRRIDAGPFSTLAAGERIAYPNQEMLTTLAAAAAVTERVRIATTIVVLPMHGTGLIAKQLATIDVISGGRLSVGVGVGGREEDYRASEGSASFPRRFRRMEEQVDLLRRLWRGEAALADVAPIGPRPVGPNGPEIMAGSLMPKSIARAARWADGVCGFSFAPDPEEIRSGFALAREAWQAAGRGRPRLVTSFWYGIGPDARSRMDAYVKSYLGFLGEAVAAQMAPVCTAVSEDALGETFAAIEDAGADEILLVPIDADLRRLDRVAEIVAARGPSPRARG